MASQSPSPIQSLSSASRAVTDSNGSAAYSSSPRLSAFLHQQEGADNSRTGLVTSHNGQRSYGTVKSQQFSSSFKRASTTVITHTLEEGDTLQGLAVKYSVNVTDIERLNGIWSTDSMYCRPTIKIPMSATAHSNSSSYNNSPSNSPKTAQRSASRSATTAAAAEDGSLNSVRSWSSGQAVDDVRESSPGDEVRAKLDIRRQRERSKTSSSSASCGEDGVKSIMDILNCVDVQLETSREFAEKLAKRSARLSVPRDAYHRTHEDVSPSSPPNGSVAEENSPKSRQPVFSPLSPKSRQPVFSPLSPKSRQPVFSPLSPKSRRRLHLKRVAPEQVEASRDEVEERLFEL